MRGATARRVNAAGIIAYSPTRSAAFILRAVGRTAFDNAAVESFFGILKTELVYRQSYMNRAEACQAISEYMEVFYNRQRRHSALGYLNPAQYEAQDRTIHSTSQAA